MRLLGQVEHGVEVCGDDCTNAVDSSNEQELHEQYGAETGDDSSSDEVERSDLGSDEGFSSGMSHSSSRDDLST